MPPNTEIVLRLTRLGAMSGSWASHVYTTEWFVEKAGFGGRTARKSLGWESIATQSIAGVVQIEDLLSQWRSQVPKEILQISWYRTVTNPFLTQSRSKVSHQYFTQTFWKEIFLGGHSSPLIVWPVLIKLAVPSDRRELQPYKLPISGILWLKIKIRLARVVGDFNLNLLVLKMCNVDEKWKTPP